MVLTAKVFIDFHDVVLLNFLSGVDGKNFIFQQCLHNEKDVSHWELGFHFDFLDREEVLVLKQQQNDQLLGV